MAGAVEGGKPIKTGQWDMGVALGLNDEWLNPYFAARKEGRSEEDPVWDFSLQQYEDDKCVARGLADLLGEPEEYVRNQFVGQGGDLDGIFPSQIEAFLRKQGLEKKPGMTVTELCW